MDSRLGLAQLSVRFQARKRWEAENDATPLCDCHGHTLTAAWNAAVREDDAWTCRRDAQVAVHRQRLAATEGLRKVGVPDQAIEALPSAHDTPSMQAARAFLQLPASKARFLVLMGQPGTGKTVAAVWVLRECLVRDALVDRASGNEARQAEAALFVRGSTFGRLSAYHDADREWFESACTARLLVLDDLGEEALSSVSASMLDELFDRRYGRTLRTVVTSNLDKEAFARRYGERIADRLRQCAVSGQSTGPSLRRRPA